MSCSVVANAKRIRLAATVLLLGLFATSSFPVVSAQDSTVNLAVCGSGAGATLTIDLPINDSVVDQSTVQVSGTVSNATQIDVSLDNQYNSTLPLSPSQTNYSMPIQLTAGTHTIALVANDVCHVQDANASVVVTYQPQSNPSTGGSTPTEVGDNNGGVTINSDPITADDDQKTGLETWPVIGPLVEFGRDMAVALDFEVNAQPGTLWRSMARFSFIVLGISATLFGNIAVSVWGWKHGPIAAKWRWGIRIAGIVLVVIAFAI